MSNWTEQRERDIRERIQNASPLPWSQDDDSMFDTLDDSTRNVVEYLHFSCEPDAALITNSPQDLVDALDEIARLRALTTVDEDMVERVARELAHMEPDEEWPSNRDLGGGPCGTRDDEYREGMYEQAREIIAVVFNTQEDA